MSETKIFWICILFGGLGALVVAGIVYFGRYLFQRSMLIWREHPFWFEMLQFWEKTGIRPNLPRYMTDAHAEYLQRRNEFWTTYGQVLVAVLIIVILSILLLTKAISAEAGLPILSGVSGFAIAKGVAGGRSNSSGPDREQ